MKTLRCDMHTFMGLSISQRRDYYLRIDPKFEELEKKILAHGGEKLIYMPEMIEPSFLLKGSVVELTTSPSLDYRQQCHPVSYKLAEAGKGTLWTGFYMTDNLWRPHSWLEIKGQFVDVTGNESKKAFGVALSRDELEYFEDFLE